MISKMKIVKNENKTSLIWEYPIYKQEVIRKNKAKTRNTLYTSRIPQTIVEFMEVTDRKIYFYEKEGIVYITSKRPQVEHQGLLLRRTTNIFSIPTWYFPGDILDGNTTTKFQLSLEMIDPYRNEYGVLTMEVVK